jgi:hypothetical protein
MALLRLVGDVEKRFRIVVDDADALIAFSFLRLSSSSSARRPAVPGAAAAEPGEAGGRENLLPPRSGGPSPRDRGDAGGSSPTAGTTSSSRTSDSSGSPAGLSRRLPANGDGPQTVLVAAADPLTALTAFVAAIGRGAQPLVLPTPKAIGGPADYRDRLRRLAARIGGGVSIALEAGLLENLAGLPGVPVLELPADVTTEPASELPARRRRSARRRRRRRLPADDERLDRGGAAGRGLAPQRLREPHRPAGLAGADRGRRPDVLLAAAVPRHGAGRRRALPAVPGVLDRHHAADRVRQGPGPLAARRQRAPLHVHRRAELRPRLRRVGGRGPGPGRRGPVALRRVGVAAEPIHRDVLQRFVDRFAPYGFRADSLVPGLGLAESTLATTTSVGRPPRYLVVATAGPPSASRSASSARAA